MTKDLHWTDSLEIAILLCEKYPDIDPSSILFTDLHAWVIALEGFVDEAHRSNEKILEAIQMYWIEERD